MYDWERIKDYLYNEPRMVEFIAKAKKECMDSNCQSNVVLLELAIEKLLDAYEDKCDDINCLVKEVKQDMQSYKNMYEDSSVSEHTKDIYMNRYSYAEDIYKKLGLILE